MKALLAIEWLKIKRYRTFWILAGFFIVLLPLWNYQIMSGMIHMGNNGLNVLSQSYSFPAVWGNMGFWGSIFVMFLSILVIILITNEFTFRTHRQNIIDGWSRLQFFHAKVAMIVIISMLATLYVFISGCLFGLGNSGSFSGMFDGIDQLFYFFLLSLNYLGFAMLIALFVRRSGLAIGLFLLYCLIIENAAKGLLNWKLSFKPGNYLPLQASDELVPLPLFQMAKQLLAQQDYSPWPYVIASIAWIAVYYFIARRLLLLRDW